MAKGKNKIPDIGQQFGVWTVIDNIENYIYPPNEHNGVRTNYLKGILVQCPHGVQKRIPKGVLIKEDSKGCNLCSTEQRDKGCGDISKSYLNSIQRDAKKRDLEYALSPEYLWKLFIKQQKRCSLSGLEITLDPNFGNYTGDDQKSIIQTASLGLIKNSAGYIEGNVQWLHEQVNMMKHSHDQDLFVDLCELISNSRTVEPRVRVIARVSVEGIHRWLNCPIDEVSYLRNYHRHIFNIIGKAYVSHSDRDIEFIQLSHNIKNYLHSKYYNEYYQCLFFDDMSCEMIADELSTKFNLFEVEVNEDGEGGSIVRNL